MKLHKITYRLFYLLVLMLLSACASNPTAIDSKYVFKQYEQLEKITYFRTQGWQAIDSQSLIVETSPNNNYLLILRRSVPDLRSAQVIEFSSSGSNVRAKFDHVLIRSNSGGFGPDPFPVQIHSIYKLKGKDDVRAVKSQIVPD